jgi:L,D-transpeptidase YcbB
MKSTHKYYTGLLCLLSLLSACEDNKSSAADTPPEHQKAQERIQLRENPDQRKSFSYAQPQARQHLMLWTDTTQPGHKLPHLNEKVLTSEVHTFYAGRDYTPAWTAEKAQELIDLLQQIGQEGLQPQAYPLDSLNLLLRQATEQEDARAGARLDLLLTASYLKLADVLATGKVKPGDYHDAWHIKPAETDSLYRHLQEGLAGSLQASLDGIRPAFDQYYRLQQHLGRYTDLAAEDWPALDLKQPLMPGDSSQQLPALRQRLYALGDLSLPSEQWQQPTYYDSALISAVNHFQARHGLEESHAISPEMLAALNVSPATRLQQIMLNMDRIRWLSAADTAKTYVLVNIPDYHLRVVEEGREIKNMRVVVGNQMYATPVFSDQIDHLVFSPYWHVPENIASEQLVPRAKTNPNYLKWNGYEVVNAQGKVVPPTAEVLENFENYRLRQKPGPGNAMGRVKFMFPNEHEIYLHDTPRGSLFDRKSRALSHGCIRIEEPEWLANWLLPQLNPEQVADKMENSQQEEVVQLADKIPVYIFYLTAFEDAEGRLNFREDIYGLDARLAEAFNGQ